MSCDMPGQMRVNAIEKNNRRGEKAKGKNTKAPVKSGAMKGFGSNKMAKRGKIAGKAS